MKLFMSPIHYGIAGLLGLALLILTPPSAEATSALYLSDVEQARESTAVVVARVTAVRHSVHPKWNRPLKHSRIEIEEVIVGSAPKVLSIEQFGGVLDGQVHYIPGDAHLLPGERCVLFLREVDGGWFLTAMKQSRYELIDGARATFVKRDLSEGLFVHTKEGLRPFAAPRQRPVQLLQQLRDKLRRELGRGTLR
ncbi:MAG: hypothetical protein CMP23_14550 [Rickettsiales bacterium]|nr:hypothetical protein [Rickettsiales bacterium]